MCIVALLLPDKQNSMNESLGALICSARKNASLDQSEFGKLIGIDDATVSKIEHGHRTLTAPELLTCTLLFEDWFEFQTESLMEELTADLATRVREFLGTTKFAPDQVSKKHWFQALLTRLDHLYEPQIT